MNAPEQTAPATGHRARLTAIGTLLNELTIVVAFVAIAGYLAATTPQFLTTANLLSILLATSLIGIVSVGETFVIVTGGIDLSPGSVVAFTGVATGLIVHAGVPIPLAMLCGIGLGAACGLFNGLAITVLNMNPFIVTLAVLAMARGLAFIVTNGNTVFGFPDAFDNIGGGNLGPFPIAALITLGVFLIAWIVLLLLRPDESGWLHYDILWGVVLVVIGRLVAFQVHRVRTLSRYYERSLPG